MKKYKNYTISAEGDLGDAMDKINSNSCKTLVVLNKNQRAIGTVSEGDLIRAFAKNTKSFSHVKNIMTTEFKFLLKENARDVINLYIDYNIGMIPICDKSMKLKKIIIVHNYLKKFLRIAK